MMATYPLDPIFRISATVGIRAGARIPKKFRMLLFFWYKLKNKANKQYKV